MRGAAAVVDVAPVGLGGEHVDVGAEAAEDLRRGPVGRAVGAVEQDAAAGQVEVGEALVQRAQVVLERAVQRRTRADRAPAPARLGSSSASISASVVVGELVAVAAEELDAVVGVRVVRGREHDAEVEAVAADQQRRAGRRQHAAEQRLAAGGGDAGGDRRLEHLARLARVADDEHARARASSGTRAVAARASASASSAVRNSPATPRTPSVPKSCGQATERATSASRTAAACGPS